MAEQKSRILDLAISSQYGPRGLGGGGRSRSHRTRASVESMADDARNTGDHNPPPSDEAALTARLQRLGERLGQKHPDRASDSNPGPAADPSAIARGFRLSAEL